VIYAVFFQSMFGKFFYAESKSFCASIPVPVNSAACVSLIQRGQSQTKGIFVDYYHCIGIAEHCCLMSRMLCSCS